MDADGGFLGNEVCWIELLSCFLLRYSRMHYWYIKPKAAHSQYQRALDQGGFWRENRRIEQKEKNPEWK